MKALLASLLLAFSAAAAPFPELGTITIENGLTWVPQPGMSFNIYASSNLYEGQLTNFVFNKVGTVDTNFWRGSTLTNLNGWRVVFLDAFKGTNVSPPSAQVLIQFDLGRPLMPDNLQIYSVLRAAATNRLPALAPPPPRLP